MSDGQPPQPSPPGPRRGRRVDFTLAGLVVGFAFLAASFTARNSDLWLHLAAGRLLAHGDFPFGVDPFAYTTSGLYWANHSWLYQLILFGAYTAVGGGGLVLLKAVGIAALAAVMLRTGSGRGPRWVVAACILLAILAMTPRLLLQPACLSVLLLGMCVELLRSGGRAAWFVPALIVLWVNTDAWFVLGPAVVGLFAVGQRLGPASLTSQPLPRWLMPASLLACLLSPHHIHALILPAELSPAVWSSGLPDDPRLAGVFVSPWRLLAAGSGGINLAAWAFVILLVAGAGSFLVNFRAIRSWRCLVWVAFAGLAVWQARLVPFFAAVGGPILALNIGDVVGPGFLNRGGRWITGLAAVTLLVIAWPGWLQGFSARDRSVGWGVVVDPSLERTARELARWRAEGLLPEGSHTAESHPDAAHYLSWFAPGEKTFLDSRLTLFTHVAADYRGLGEGIGALPEGTADRPWEVVCRDHAIAAVVVADPDGRRFVASVRRVGQADRWELLRVEGAAVIVAPKGAGTCRPAVSPFDPAKASFGASDEEAAPGSGPASLPEPAGWQDFLARRSRVESREAGAADVYLRLFESTTLARPAPPGGANRSPALPLLAVRAGRVVVSATPDDSAAWLALGRAYLALSRGTWEAEGTPTLSLLGPLRHIQIAAALHQAVALDADSVPAHDLLASLFAERQYHDLAFRHRSAHLRLIRRAGPLPGEDSQAFATRLAPLAEATEQLERAVQDAENRFLVHTFVSAGDPLARARVALQYGLVAKAQEVLLTSHPDLYGAEGIALLVRILVQTGQVEEARVLLDRDELVRNPGALGMYELPGGMWEGRPWGYRLTAYHWFDLCQAAGAGRYDRAAIALDRLHARLDREYKGLSPQVRRALAQLAGSEIGLAAPGSSPLARLHVGRERARLVGYAADATFLLIQRADLHIVGGLLLAEQGEPTAADTEFSQALNLYRQAEAVSPHPPGRGIAVSYQDAIRRASR